VQSLLSERILKSLTLPLQSTEEQDTQSCLVRVYAVPDSPTLSRLNVVEQARADHSIARRSRDRYLLQLSQFNRF